jgi:transposase-like protein
MRFKVNRFTDELKFKIVQEYLSTDLTQKDLKQKYQFGGAGNIQKWMLKFDLVAPSEQQIELQRTMGKQNEKTAYELELEAKIKKLEQQLDYQELKAEALSTMIDIAERELKITIRKKSGAKQ